MKKLILIALAVCASRLASAAEVTAAQAQVAVDAWLQDDAALGCTLGGAAESTRTCAATNGAPFHVVKLAGGGFVVTSADTTLEPIIAFSDGDDLIESEENPLWALLMRDLAARTRVTTTAKATGARRLTSTVSSSSGESSTANEKKWADLLKRCSSGAARKKPLTANGDGVSSVSDVRVAPLVQSKWNQGNVGKDYCYNYYTPNHYVCGCVATAGAQIMRYFEWPSAMTSIPAFTNDYCYLEGLQTSYTTRGGSYNWSLMPLVPGVSMTDDERQAIGKLTSDIGICVGMDYNSASNGGSGAFGYMLAEAFTNQYGYANALALEWDGDQSGTDALNHALISNLDAGLPVEVSIRGDSGGHSIVGDGYGYSGDTLYYHFNMGWSGTANVWYAPPKMNTENGLYFSFLDGVVCNIFTNASDKGGVICSGHVLDATGTPIADAVVSVKKGSGSILRSTTTNAKGIYALVLTDVPPIDTSYILTATSGGSRATRNVSLKANVGVEIRLPDGYEGYSYGDSSVGNRCGQDITITGVATVDEPQFNPASCLFYPSTNVTITCATEGATIRYTTNGTDPTEYSAVYTGPIAVDDDTKIRARAWKIGMNPSAVVVETYTYDNSFNDPKGDRFANPIVISGASGSRTIANNSAYTVEAGEPNHTHEDGYQDFGEYHTVWYKWTAPGSGTMTFKAKRKSWNGLVCIAAYAGDSWQLSDRLNWNYDDDGDGWAMIEIVVEQGQTYRIVGMMTWGGDPYTGEFTLTWSGDLTVATTEVPVQLSWLETNGLVTPGSDASAYEAAAVADSDGDGLPNWAEYVCGTSPTNSNDKLSVTIHMENGQPVVETSLNDATVQGRGFAIVTKGTNNLSDWEVVTDTKTSTNHFFKVVIEPISSGE